MILNITFWDILNYWGVKPIDFILIGFTFIFIIIVIIVLVKIKRNCSGKKPTVNDGEQGVKCFKKNRFGIV